MHQNYIDFLHNALNHRPTPKARALRFLVGFQVSNLAQFIFSIRRPHNDTRISASNVSCFNWLLRSLSTKLCLEHPRSHIVVLPNPKLQSVQGWSCRSYWKLKVSARMPRWSPTLILVTHCNHYILWHALFGEAFIVKDGKFGERILWSAPKMKHILNGQNCIWQVLKTSVVNADDG